MGNAIGEGRAQVESASHFLLRLLGFCGFCIELGFTYNKVVSDMSTSILWAIPAACAATFRCLC